VRTAEVALNGDQHTPSSTGSPFFGHGARQSNGTLSNDTRYLCAAAYLNSDFADQVIWELVVSHRAVAPSVNIDLGPIVRHCLRAKRITLIQNIVLAILILAGLYFRPLPTIDFLLISFTLGVMLPKARWKERDFRSKVPIAFGFMLAAGTIISFTLFLLVGSSLATLLATHSFAAAAANEGNILLTFLLLLAVTWMTEYSFQYTAFRAYTEHLRPGAKPPSPGSSATEGRIATVEAAQWGNVTLYAKDPFIGTGDASARTWSIAIELDRARPAQRDITARTTSRGYAPIDPVELHQAIRERLLKLNDPGLPPHERISAIAVADRVVGPGLVRWDSPLLDMSRRAPFSEASPEAIEALIRHPQAGLRYYQQVSVSDQGPPVLSGNREVIESIDQGVAVSAFIYAAVEGRMFYIQFDRTALPPVAARYKSIDLIPNMSPGRLQATVIWASLKSMFHSYIYSPARIVAAIRLKLQQRHFKEEFAPHGGSVVGDFGTRESVRQLGAADSFSTHIEKLDVEKYTRIIERLLVDTVLDFLASKGVDTSAFASSAATIINGDVISGNTISGDHASVGGHGNVFNAAPGQAPAPGAG
jgi:hypothetical protein